jgi:hypothetical protein
MADPDPLNLLTYVSMLMYMTDPRRVDPFAGPQEQTSIRREELLPTFLDVPCPETSALLAALAEMISDDDVLCARIRRELAARPRLQPAWLADLGATRISRALLMGHILGDGDNIILGVDLPGGRSGTITVYVDHNLGTLVKDAFTISESFDTVVAKYREVNEDPDTTFTDLDLADARARIEAAIDRAAMTYPPFETDTWPACRALVEWLIRRLPRGGSGWPGLQWESDSLDDLADRFFRSDAGSQLDDSDRRAMLESLLWFATDYSTGDPMRWSPVKVELLLMDWLPRKVLAAADYLDLVPEILRAFITFVHGEAAVRADLTADTLAAVDHYEPQYRSLVRTPRPQGVDAVLAALGLDDDESDRSVADIMLECLDNEVGGRVALDGLDDRPLPDEPFCWDRIDPDVAERVREVLILIDRCCDDLLDTEYRTACRRLLARLAAPAEAFRRKGKPGDRRGGGGVARRQGQRPVLQRQPAGERVDELLRSEGQCFATCRDADAHGRIALHQLQPQLRIAELPDIGQTPVDHRATGSVPVLERLLLCV